jgi:hypothetical protein
MFAFMSGTQTESYIAHSPRFHVRHPSNADDATITHAHCPNEPLSIPTEMTYSILRIRIATIFRELMDAAATQGLSLHEVPYESILAFDQRITAFTDSIPWFLRTPTPTTAYQCAQLDQQRPYLAWQRLMSQFGPSTSMSGVHRAYMTRGATDPRYAHSRTVCLRAARTVLDMEKSLHTTSASPLAMPAPSKIWALMYQVFFATMVLIMDYHLHKSEPGAEERMQEIMECCRRLDAAKGVSDVAARGLEGLQGAMRRWGLLKDEHVNPAASNEGNLGHEMPELGGSEFAETSWTDLLDFEVELEAPQWDALFQDLESHSSLL